MHIQTIQYCQGRRQNAKSWLRNCLPIGAVDVLIAAPATAAAETAETAAKQLHISYGRIGLHPLLLLICECDCL